MSNTEKMSSQKQKIALNLRRCFPFYSFKYSISLSVEETRFCISLSKIYLFIRHVSKYITYF